VQRADKKQFVKEFNLALKDSEFLLVANYKGLNVSEISSLRNDIKNSSKSNFRVAKNTLAKKALKDTNFDVVEKLFVGPTSVAYSDDPVSTSKIAVKFAENNVNFKILGGVMGDKELSVEEINELASLPSMDEVRAKIVGLLVSAQRNLLSTLTASQSSIVRIIDTKFNSQQS
tara:strand:- start:500 stop:1018 length:519 start_codon:yes stop_codon:yes gene_type:complete